MHLPSLLTPPSKVRRDLVDGRKTGQSDQYVRVLSKAVGPSPPPAQVRPHSSLWCCCECVLWTELGDGRQHSVSRMLGKCHDLGQNKSRPARVAGVNLTLVWIIDR